MSWDPNAGAPNYDDGYGNYGNYNEQPQQFAAGDGRPGGASESSYDMFAGNSGYGGGGGAQQSSFYNPNDFNASQGGGGGGNDSAYYPGAPQTQQSFQHPGTTNAYRRWGKRDQI